MVLSEGLPAGVQLENGAIIHHLNVYCTATEYLPDHLRVGQPGGSAAISLDCLAYDSQILWLTCDAEPVYL